LVRTMNEMRIQAILKQPFEPAKYPDFLAAKTGARVIVLAASVGAVPEASDYFALFDYNVKALSGG
jgi:ABC-type Zn uptake system ZnuABC Zn-binding protein ZnuA